MAVLEMRLCHKCDTVYEDCWSDEPLVCCGKEAKLYIGRVNSFEWGGPKTFIHLRDEPFADRAELNTWTKARGMSLGESSEKVRGARNDEYEGAGKLYSYKGSSSKANTLYSNGVKRS
jgi:hypothetical protein